MQKQDLINHSHFANFRTFVEHGLGRVPNYFEMEYENLTREEIVEAAKNEYCRNSMHAWIELMQQKIALLEEIFDEADSK